MNAHPVPLGRIASTPGGSRSGRECEVIASAAGRWCTAVCRCAAAIRAYEAELPRYSWVPRYFFNFENHQSMTADLVGTDLPDDEAARIEAAKLAADQSIADAVEGELPAFAWIEVIGEDQRPIARLPVGDTIHEPNRIR